MAIVGKGMTMTKNQKKKAEQPKLKPKKQKAHVIRALKNKEPKLVENTKNLLLMRGGKTNAVMNEVLSDLKKLKTPDAKLFAKRNDMQVFEDDSHIEFLTQKNDASCFMIGTSTKKRPQNLVFGRTFDGHVLDMIEMGVENYKSIADIKSESKKAIGSKPCFIFTGDVWETSQVFQKFKNMLVDTFRGQVCKDISLAGLDHVIACTASGNRVLFRTYIIGFEKSGDSHPRVELSLMGPSMDLSFRRTKFASADLLKLASKKPKGLLPKKQKNVKRDPLTGDKVGRVHLDHQDLNTMQVRRVKALRKTPGELKATKRAEESANTDMEE